MQLSAFAGDIGGGTKAVVSFDCIVNDDAVGADITNVAQFQGSKLDPNDIPAEGEEQDTIDDPKPTPTNPATPEQGPKV